MEAEITRNGFIAGVMLLGATAFMPAVVAASDISERVSSLKPPEAFVSPLLAADAARICLKCREDQMFHIGEHAEILDRIAAESYVGSFRRALYWQDTRHQFESKAHFDNCDFDGSVGYVNDLMEEVAAYVAEAERQKAAGDKRRYKNALRLAYFSLGQALHAVQDFYAHTNYIELEGIKHSQVQDVPIVDFWEREGGDHLAELRKNGLISGFVSWGSPKVCKDATVTHGDLAKDSADTKAGKIRLPMLQNETQFEVAFSLAQRASARFLARAMKNWPLLGAENRDDLVAKVLTDSRRL